jgi:ligand-binding sensor domain-containing protein/signal transduction histidine kinase
MTYFQHFQRLAFVMLLCLAASFVQAQPDLLEKVRFTRLEEKAGLSNSNVTCILQDSRGYMWIGTEDGLNKFNGYEFRVYRHDSKDTCTILTNSIRCIYEDSEHRLWVSTRPGGLHYYDDEHDRFIRVPGFLKESQIIHISEDADHNVLFGGARDINTVIIKLDRKTKKWETHNLFRSDEPIMSIVPDANGEFWIGVRKTGFMKWNSRTNQIIKDFQLAANSEPIRARDIRKIIKDENEVLWIAAAEGLTRFDLKTKVVKNFTAHPGDKHQLLVNPIFFMAADGNYLWLATENGGLSRFDKTSNTFTNFVYNKDDPFSLSDNAVWTVYKDKQNRLWVGTFSKGLCVIDHLANKFSQLNTVLPNDIVNAIYQDSKNRLWIGTEGGLVRKDGEHVRYYSHQDGQPYSLSSNPVLSIYEDSKKQLWFGTWAGGINRYREATDDFVNYPADAKNPSKLTDPNVYAICEHKQTGQLLVASYHGLNVLKSNGTFDHYYAEMHESDNYVRTIYEDSKGVVWVGTIEELNMFDPQKKTLVMFDRRPFELKTSEMVNSILEDNKGRIWVGSNQGLQKLESGKLVKRYTAQEGLPSTIVNGILEDRKGNLWISTSKGLSQFDPERNTFMNYDVNDGLLSNEFKPNACFKDKEGRMFFGGKGVNVFDPQEIQKNPFPPPVYITDFKIFNKSVAIGTEDSLLSKHISLTREITLSHRYNFFSFEFAALNFSSSEKNQYAYRLVGFDPDWVYIGNKRSAIFTNLDPGTYTLRIKASNNDGLWNETGTSLIIHILPPFWKTWWFRTLLFVTLVMCIWIFYKARLQSIKLQNRRLEHMVTKRTEELQNTNQQLVLREKEIQVQNHELLQQREELASQNEQLRMARALIQEQNLEITQKNETLETEVKERTKELVDYNEQLEQFAFVTAHNLRAPAARILGLGYILNKVPDQEEQKMILSKLVSTTTELDEVIRDLSAILVIRQNRDSEISIICLQDEWNQVVKKLSNEIAETNTVIKADFSQAPHVRHIRNYINSIFENLLTNSIRYRHDERTPFIEVQSKIITNYVVIQFRDNGLGIDLVKFKEKIFMPYSHFHTRMQGRGIGLYLVKAQVVALGGRVEVESTPNEGTTFSIMIRQWD